LSQEKYFNDILAQFKMDWCHLVTPPFQASFKFNKRVAPITIENVITMKEIPFKLLLES
jgi:hypothetical protein